MCSLVLFLPLHLGERGQEVLDFLYSGLNRKRHSIIRMFANTMKLVSCSQNIWMSH